MNLELAKEDLDLLAMLLSKTEVETRVEIHHADRSFEYRDYLKARQKQVSSLLERVKQLSKES